MKERKTFSLILVSNFLSILLGFVTNIIFSSRMSVEDYGIFKYSNTIFYFLLSVILFGIQYSASRIIINEKNDKEQRKIIGCTLVISIGISLFFGGIASIVFSILNKSVFSNLNGHIYIGFFLYTVILQNVLNICMQAYNKMKLIAMQNVLPFLLMLISVAFLCINKVEITFGDVFFISVFAYTITIFYLIYRLKPIFKDCKKNINLLWKENQKSGFHIYIGALSGVGINNLIAFVLGTCISSESYGVFSLALSLSVPLAQIGATLGVVNYKQYSSIDKIDYQQIIKLFTLVLTTYIVGYFGIKIIFPLVFSVDYIDVIKYFRILSIGTLILGIGDFFNKFLLAKGEGKRIKKITIVTGLISFVIAIITVQFWGVWGAILSRVISNSFYGVYMFIEYKKYIDEAKEG